jgi:hypothetical protein
MKGREHKSRSKDNIEKDLKGTVYEDIGCIDVRQGCVQWLAFVTTVLKLHVP